VTDVSEGEIFSVQAILLFIHLRPLLVPKS